MNGLERCLNSLNRQSIDKVPVVPQGFLFAIETSEFRMSEVVHNPENMAKALMQCWEQYDYDGIVIDFDDATLAEACGASVIFRDIEPAMVDESKPVITNWSDLDKLRLPDPNKSGRLPVWLETTRILSKQLGREVMIMGRADQGPFTLASLLRGTQNFMMDLMTEDPQPVHELIDYCTEAFTRFAKAQKDAGAHFTSMGDALAGPNLISPDLYRTFAWKPECTAVRAIQDYGISFSLHICGNTTAIIDEMLQTESKVLEIDWQVDLAEVIKKAHGQTIIMGNINPSHPIVTGTRQEVYKETIKLLQQTKGKGIWLSTGCAIGRNTPPENFEAFIRAGRDFPITT